MTLKFNIKTKVPKDQLVETILKKKNHFIHFLQHFSFLQLIAIFWEPCMNRNRFLGFYIKSARSELQYFVN